MAALSKQPESDICTEDDVAKLMSDARVYAHAKKYDEAVRCYCDVLEKNPSAEEALHSLREIALKHYLRLPSTDSESIESEESTLAAYEKVMQNESSTATKFDYLKRAVVAFSADPSMQARFLRNLGVYAVRTMDNVQYGMVCYLSACSILLGTMVDAEELQTIRLEMARIYLSAEKISTARNYIDRALKIAEFLGRDNLAVLVQLGIQLLHEGKYEESIVQLKQTERLATETGSSDDRVESLHQLGEAFMYIGDLEQAIAYCKRCLDEATDAERVAATTGTLATAHLLYSFRLAKNDVREFCVQLQLAEQRYREALTFTRSSRDRINRTARLGATLALQGRVLANVADAKAKSDEAKTYFEAALTLASQTNERTFAAYVHAELSQLYLLNFRNVPVALEYSRKAVEMTREYATDEHLAEALVNHGMCLLEADRREEAIDCLLKAERSFHGHRETGVRTDELRLSFSERSVDCNELLQAAYIMTGDNRKALETLERGRAEALQAELMRKVKRQRMDERHEMGPLSAAEIARKARETNACFVFYGVSDRSTHVYAFVVVPGREEPLRVMLPVGRQEFGVGTQRPNSLEFELHAPEEAKGHRCSADRNAKVTLIDGSCSADSLSHRNLKAVYEALWQRFEDQLTTELVVIFPQAFLWGVPFEALLTSDAQRLVARHSTIYAPSVATLQLIDKGWSNVKENASELSLVVGNPLAKNTSPLPVAETEARNVAKLLNNVLPFCGQDATLDVVMNILPEARYAHFATHGLLDAPGQRNVGVRGALILARGENDNLLRAETIQELDLSRLELAVLSCCFTGRGNLMQEGLLGLGRAFLFAGCKAVLLARWAIPDSKGTNDFMVRFYEKYLEGMGPADALRAATLAAINDGRSVAEWGSFYVLGSNKR